MSHGYKAVTWTPFKLRYDIWMLGAIAAYLATFITASFAAMPEGESFTPIQVLIRATGTLAFGLLTFILTIGPLARLTPRFLPLLYNRRHLGVTTFLVALVHAGLVLLWYHGFSSVNVFVSLLASNPRYDAIAGFPFESLGLGALVVMFLMAATSHDFWNANLGPGAWKALHMGVYLAFAALVAHVMLGAIQSERHPLFLALVAVASALVAGLHIVTAFRNDPAPVPGTPDADWIDVGPAASIPDARARIITPPTGERIAVFRSGDRIHAVSNVCRHQGGPLGEGRIIDGCITCPWHGFQYRPDTGQSPPPFTEKIATYATRIVAGIVQVCPTPNPPGTPQPPSIIQPEPDRT